MVKTRSFRAFSPRSFHTFNPIRETSRDRLQSSSGLCLRLLRFIAVRQLFVNGAEDDQY